MWLLLTPFALQNSVIGMQLWAELWN